MTLQRHPALAALDLGSATALLERPVFQRVGSSTDFVACAEALARWYVEFRAGRRPAEQLRTMVSGALLRRMRGRAAERQHTLEIDPIVRTVVQRPSADQVEAVVLVRRGPRVGAVTVSFARTERGWIITDLTAPEDGEAPAGRTRRAHHGFGEETFDVREELR
ncbi:MAG: hypothetical protein ACI867_001977 [Glaciecola sp.]|jgi:hypothetical protein